MTDNKVLIKVENLKKHYTGGVVKALDGVNCEIKKGAKKCLKRPLEM